MIINDEYIKNYFTSGSRIMKSKLKKLPDDCEIIQYLKNRYNDSYSLEESLYRIFNNIETKELCPICKKPISLFSFKYGFMKTCDSKECIKKYKNLNSSFHNKQTQDKVKKVIKEKYGVNNPYQIENVKNKAILRLKEEDVINKRKQTCIEKYGVDNPSKSDFVKNKIKTKLKNKTLTEKEEIINKHKETFLNKYGVSWYSKLPEYKEKMSQVISSEVCLDKRRKTSLIKYGIETYNNPEKRNNTLKENNSFGKSKQEDICYNLLKEKYPDIIRQYTSEFYPFSCDFYIPSIDTYIEYNGSQYHMKHPFNENDKNDIIKLNELKDKAYNSIRHKNGKKSQYDMIIYTWTDLDVRKRKIAKENNINFMEFYSIDSLKQYLLNT